MLRVHVKCTRPGHGGKLFGKDVAKAGPSQGGVEAGVAVARYVEPGLKGCAGRNLIRGGGGGPGLFCTHCISLTPLNYAVNNIHQGAPKLYTQRTHNDLYIDHFTTENIWQ